MGKRGEAGWRFLALLWAWTLGGMIAGILMILGLILGVIDIILQAILGTDAISRTGFSMTAVANSLQWWADLQIFAFTGRGDGFGWVPPLN